jgi:hypothetical protein
LVQLYICAGRLRARTGSVDRSRCWGQSTHTFAALVGSIKYLLDVAIKKTLAMIVALQRAGVNVAPSVSVNYDESVVSAAMISEETCVVGSIEAGEMVLVEPFTAILKA